MAMISASWGGWQDAVAVTLPTYTADLNRATPGVRVQLRVDQYRLLAVLTPEEPSMAPQAAHLVAEHLAPLWPSMLTAHSVPLRITAGDAGSWTADAVTMDVLATEGIDQAAWLAVTSR